MGFFTAMNLVYAAITVMSIIDVILIGRLLVIWGEIRGTNKTWDEISNHFRSCCDVAYDDGITEWDEQQMIMRELGSELADHLCDQRESDGEIRCACLCIRGI